MGVIDGNIESIDLLIENQEYNFAHCSETGKKHIKSYLQGYRTALSTVLQDVENAISQIDINIKKLEKGE